MRSAAPIRPRRRRGTDRSVPARVFQLVGDVRAQALAAQDVLLTTAPGVDFLRAAHQARRARRVARVARVARRAHAAPCPRRHLHDGAPRDVRAVEARVHDAEGGGGLGVATRTKPFSCVCVCGSVLSYARAK